MSEKRITELDSLRGIAAFTVLINHCALVYPIVSDFFHTRDVHNSGPVLKSVMFSPVHSLWNGHAAVILFFILSGFVLSVSHYNKEGTPSYKTYLIKRMCRLYIPYFVTLAISVLLVNFYQKQPVATASEWFNGMWQQSIDLKGFIGYLFLQGDLYKLGTTLWTIVVEIEIALILPFFFILIKKGGFLQNMLLLIVCIVGFKLLRRTPLVTIIPDLNNLYYLPFFLFGGIIYKYRDTIKQVQLPAMVVIFVFFPAALVLYNWDWVLPWFIKFSPNHILYLVTDYMVAFGGCLFIISCLLHLPGYKRIMNKPVFMFLGDISYSLYLVHPILLLIIVHAFSPVSYNVLIFVVILSSVLFAYFYYLAVEKPSIRLGRSLAKATA